MDDFSAAVIYAANVLAKGWSAARTLAGLALRFGGLSNAARASALSMGQLGTANNINSSPYEGVSFPGLSEIASGPIGASGELTIKVTVDFPEEGSYGHKGASRIFTVDESGYQDQIDGMIRAWIKGLKSKSPDLKDRQEEPLISINYIFRGE